MAPLAHIVLSTLVVAGARAHFPEFPSWPFNEPCESNVAPHWPWPSHYSWKLSWGHPIPTSAPAPYTLTSAIKSSVAPPPTTTNSVPLSSSSASKVTPSSGSSSKSSISSTTISLPTTSTVVTPSSSSTTVVVLSSSSTPSAVSSSALLSSSSSALPVVSSSTLTSSVVPSSSSATPGGPTSSPLGNITCPTTGVHVIVARGSLEQQGEGLTASLANNITARIPGSNSQALVYPATLIPYFPSEDAGVQNLTLLLQQFNQVCPTSKFVLLGWSQGGQLTLDTLCGNSEIDFNQTQPIPQQYTKNLVAAVVYGDPSHKLNQPYNRGTATRDGIFNRTDTQACTPYFSLIESYCDLLDPYCTNSNASGLAVHFGYFDKYNQAATDFVVSRFNAMG